MDRFARALSRVDGTWCVWLVTRVGRFLGGSGSWATQRQNGGGISFGHNSHLLFVTYITFPSTVEQTLVHNPGVPKVFQPALLDRDSLVRPLLCSLQNVAQLFVLRIHCRNYSVHIPALQQSLSGIQSSNSAAKAVSIAATIGKFESPYAGVLFRDGWGSATTSPAPATTKSINPRFFFNLNDGRRSDVIH